MAATRTTWSCRPGVSGRSEDHGGRHRAVSLARAWPEAAPQARPGGPRLTGALAPAQVHQLLPGLPAPLLPGVGRHLVRRHRSSPQSGEAQRSRENTRPPGGLRPRASWSLLRVTQPDPHESRAPPELWLSARVGRRGLGQDAGRRELGRPGPWEDAGLSRRLRSRRRAWRFCRARRGRPACSAGPLAVAGTLQRAGHPGGDPTRAYRTDAGEAGKRALGGQPPGSVPSVACRVHTASRPGDVSFRQLECPLGIALLASREEVGARHLCGHHSLPGLPPMSQENEGTAADSASPSCRRVPRPAATTLSGNGGLTWRWSRRPRVPRHSLICPCIPQIHAEHRRDPGASLSERTDPSPVLAKHTSQQRNQ